MLKEKNCICENWGKACLVSAAVCSVLVLIKVFLCKDKDCDDYRKRLRRAYEELSSEEY